MDSDKALIRDLAEVLRAARIAIAQFDGEGMRAEATRLCALIDDILARAEGALPKS